MKFFMQCDPPTTTHQANLRVNTNRATGQQFIGKRESEKGAIWKKKFWALAHPYKPEKPFDGPLKLHLVFVYPWPKTRSHAGVKMFKETIPDFDNIGKTLVDVMSDLGFWVNDSRIADGRTTKLFSYNTGIAVSLRKLTERDLDEFIEYL